MLQIFENHSGIPLQNAVTVIPSPVAWFWRTGGEGSAFPYLFTSLLLSLVFFREVINRIAETITHIQANQSP